MIKRKVVPWIGFLTVLLLWSTEGFAISENENHELPAEEEFQPGEFIMEHIGDAYEWHILTYKDFHLSIPLPVILYSKYSGFHVFMSARFGHGHNTWKGFRISQEEPHRGKIVEGLGNGTVVKPLDLSITKNVLAVFVSVIVLLWLFIAVAKKYERTRGKAPTGFQNMIETVILFIRDDVARPSIGERHYERFMPYLLTLFFFILANNLMGLIPVFPFGANVTGNIAVTGILAFFTLMVTTLSGNRHYWKDIFNAPGVPWWLKVPIPMMPVIELFGMLTKPLVLMVRLFANITAGHIIAMGFFSLIFIFGSMDPALGWAVSPLTVVFTIFMGILEILVAFIQAYVFTLLSALYFGMATAEQHGT
ncbi:MAG TPA: ATP synthase F0 subunit A [Bacteroidetes bacterium]|nr:ATP synthase F0 subunit A [Bacteroidota bacterium]